jgi:hypothetical protein
MTWAVWVLVICAAVSFACLLYGVIRAALAARAVKQHVDRLKATPLADDAAKAAVYGRRIGAALPQIEALLVRANAAISTISDALKELRIPEAVAALRTAGAAIRLLFSGR